MIYRQVTGDESVKVGHHVITKFLQDYEIRIRTNQTGKKQSKTSMVEPLKKWNATFRMYTPIKVQVLSEVESFLLIHCLNVDQPPLLFVFNLSKTYEYAEKGEKNHNFSSWVRPGQTAVFRANNLHHP